MSYKYERLQEQEIPSSSQTHHNLLNTLQDRSSITTKSSIAIKIEDSERDLEGEHEDNFTMSQNVSEQGRNENNMGQIPTRVNRRTRKERLSNVIQPYDFNWESAGPLDQYLERVYRFYEGKGFSCILLTSILNLATLFFVVSFTTFVGGCIDFKKIKPHSSLHDAVVENCFTGLHSFAKIILFIYLFILIWQAVRLIYEVRDLLEMYHFYTKVLGIPDEDMQTVDWEEIVKRMTRLPPPVSSSEEQPFDAYTIAHRIMRLDNYMIGLFNMKKVDLNVPLPSFLGGGHFPFSLTRGMEWSLTVCLADTFFDKRGRLHRGVLRWEERAIWAGKLRRKLHFMGFINLIFGPIVVLYTICYLVFRYFEEYYKTPKTIGLRQYTVLAKWQVREFNELPHYLRNRLDASIITAEEYLDQFPRYKMTMINQFVALVCGTLAGGIALLALIDSELVLQFDVIPGWSILSFGAVLGIILTATRSPSRPTADTQVLLANLLEQLHYMPQLWKDRLHSEKVRREFSQMFSLKALQLAEEVIGLFMTPYFLFFLIPRSCYKFVDFFRDGTAYMPGVGHVCSLALFDLGRQENESGNLNPERVSAQDGKLEKSLITFKAHNPEWIPNDPSSSIYLSHFSDSLEVRNNTGTNNHMSASLQSHTSQLEEPVSTNPLDQAIPMRVLTMMLEQPRNL